MRDPQETRTLLFTTMQVIFRWTCSRARSEADVRLARFKRVLRSAQRTCRYQPVLERAGLGTDEALAAIDSVEGVLERLPAIDLDEFRGSRAAFESPHNLRTGLQPFRSPLEHTPRTAILMQGFEQNSKVRIFADCGKRVKRFGATALAAPVSKLRELAAAIENGRGEIRQLRHFVVSFTGTDHGEIGEEDRERFWRVFQVPVFEQRLGFDGRVIAYECEAHHGLHIETERAAFEETAGSELLLTSLTDLRYPTLRVGTRMTACIRHDCCDCGNASARVVAGRLPSLAKRLSPYAFRFRCPKAYRTCARK